MMTFFYTIQEVEEYEKFVHGSRSHVHGGYRCDSRSRELSADLEVLEKELRKIQTKQ